MPQDNASVIVKRDTKSVIDQTPKVNGQMLWTTDIGQDNHIYTDVIDPSDNTVKRIQMGGILPETEQAIQQAVTDASASATSASTSATNASNSATEAESYAKGGTGTRTGEDTDNAKYYKEQADVSATNASTSASNASASATTATNKATEASTSATNASNSATQASNNATLSESYAKGGTGIRQGEDTDNAEYYKEQAKAYAESASQGVQPATSSTIGGVKPDNVTITVDGVGTITAQEVQEITQANFDALTTKNPKIAYFVKSSTSGTTGRIWYNDSWFGGTDITIDTVLDTTSNNPIANSTVATALAGKQNSLTTTQLKATNSGITSAKVSKLDALPTSTQLETSLSNKANKSDITNISITSTTNNTGSKILTGTLFYLNGTLCKTLTDIASGATFTEGTNYVPTTLNNIQPKVNSITVDVQSPTTMSLIHTFNLPSGTKLVRAKLSYNVSQPVEMYVAERGVNYDTFGHSSKLNGVDAGALNVVGITDSDTISVYGKYDTAGLNGVTLTYVML
jgi:hypothetical protein